MRSRLIYSIGVLLLVMQAFTVNAQKKPNVIYITVDDLSICFDSYGNPEVKTPNIDRLASHGTLFKNVYCQYALCNPSRTSSLSGQRPDKTQVFDNQADPRKVLGPNFRFLPEFFHDNGYQTERYGKAGPCGHEFSVSWDWGSLLHGKSYKVEGDPYWWIDTTYDSEDETFRAQLTDEMIGRMRKPVSEPYFYGFAMSTHNPFTPLLENWNKLGDPTVQEKLKVDMDGNYGNVVGNGSGNIILPDAPANDLDDIPAPALKKPIIYPDDEWQRMRHAYYSEIIELDDVLGTLLDELDRTNAWDNTIIVFSSDHGIHLGEHGGQWLKQTLFEETLRVPLIICAPGKKKGAICERPVELVDLFATLNELAGIPAPPDHQGASLVPLLENANAVWKKGVFGQVQRKMNKELVVGRSARTQTFVYNSWEKYGEELYDIVNDPFQYTNLALNPAYQTELTKMRNLLAGGWEAALPPAYRKRVFYEDKDGDGYGGDVSIEAYFPPDGFTAKGGDCDDTKAKVNPGAKERLCNGIDDNCNGVIDEGLPVPTVKVSGNTDICQTGSVKLRTAGGKAYKVQWKKDGKNISGATSKTYTATEPGSYTVVISNDQCSSSSEAVVVTNSCPKISQGVADGVSITSSSMSVYPSPSKGNVTVNYNAVSAGSVQLKVIDMSGKTLYINNQKISKGKNSFNLQLSQLNNGVYYLQILDQNKTLNAKLVIEK